jgi:hypothetical protein
MMFKLAPQYAIGNVVKNNYQKWVHNFHLELWNKSYGQKNSHESIWQLNSQPLKVKKKKIKWPFNWTCDMKLESLFKGYKFPLRDFQLKLVCKNHEPIKLRDS